MNCPSRTDEDFDLHPHWNQNPPFLPADLTTREDMNGLVNARAHRKDSDCGNSDLSLLQLEATWNRNEPDAKDKLGYADGRVGEGLGSG